MTKTILSLALACVILFGSCVKKDTENNTAGSQESADFDQLLAKYKTFRLTSDLSHLSENQRKMLPLFIEAAEIMDKLFWYEAFGGEDSLLSNLKDPAAKEFVKINYGPWDRIDDNKPFIQGYGAKPDGSNFYPFDMTKEEFEEADLPDKRSQYNFLRRDNSGSLMTVPYHIAFEADIEKAAQLLDEAADLAEDPGFKKYLSLRAIALRTDDYFESDMAWMDMKDNMIDFVVGPIENYEDMLFNYKAAHEAYILIKDLEWSKKLEKYAQFMPALQAGLPVPEAYKQEKAGTDADLNAYDVIYYAGDCNSGSKTIAINLPNDEKVQLAKGSRRLQLKNVMKAKYDIIMIPIADALIHADQRSFITFDAFFANGMFHEVAHGLGIKNTLDGTETVRRAIKEHYSALEEGKADILGLYMITKLLEIGEVEGQLENYYVTFMAGIFRSIRFGAARAHGKANMIRFNFFNEMGAFERDEATGTYRVNFDKMQTAVNELSNIILTIQGDGDYDEAAELINTKGVIGEVLASDLDRLHQLGIPIDIVFEQGMEYIN